MSRSAPSDGARGLLIVNQPEPGENPKESQARSVEPVKLRRIRVGDPLLESVLEEHVEFLRAIEAFLRLLEEPRFGVDVLSVRGEAPRLLYLRAAARLIRIDEEAEVLD